MKLPCVRQLRLSGPVLAIVFLAVSGLGFGQATQIFVHDGGHNDSASAVATDASGAIFVGGHSNTDDTPVTFAVLKYNAAGNRQWLARVQGMGAYNGSTANDIAIDAEGNTYAVGYASQPLPFLQNDLGFLVASFDPNGVQRWARLVNGPGNSFDIAYRIAVAAQQGAIYVTGITSGTSGYSDWITVKYSLAGVELWRRSESGAGNAGDQPVAIKVDGAGNVVVLGSVQPGNVTGPKDIRVVKLDPSGNVLWRTDYSDTAGSDEMPSDLVIDAGNNIYVTANRGASVSAEDASVPITLKFDPDGNRLFVLAGPGQGGSGIALDAAGSFIVSGVFTDVVGSNTIPMTTKFTPNGVPVWSLPFAGRNLAVDEIDGSIYLTRDALFTAVKISTAGQILWEQAVPAGNTPNDAVVDDATGAYVVTGNSSLGNGNMITARFSAGSPPPPTVLSAPSGLSATVKKGAITLAWIDNSNNESGFLIERSTNGGSFVQIAQTGANVRNFNNTGLVKNSSYAYRIRAFNTSGNSAYSNTATGTPR